MTGFYRNMATGDYDEYRDTEDVQSQQHKKRTKQEKKFYNQRRFTSDDLRPVGDDDYDY
jgi:hypothetical protein